MNSAELLEFKKLASRLLIFAAPFLFISVTYFILDPFQVVYPRDNYYLHCHVEPNRDFVTTEVFLRNSKKIPFDSFIFGNSRSLAFRCREWMKYIKGSAAYHYDASNESLYGVWAKLKFLDSRGQPVRNVLWIVDSQHLEQTGTSPLEKEHTSMKHPLLSGTPWFPFHLGQFGAYFERLFFLKYLDYRLFHTYRRYMGDVIMEKALKYDPVSNDEVRNPRGESEVAPEKYYLKKYKHIFYAREGSGGGLDAPVIGEKQLFFLNEARAILEKHHARYQVVVSPLYNQIRFNPQDLLVLQKIFGAGNVHDFSGVNEFTKDTRNYFEASHYKPKVADEILRRIYPDRAQVSLIE